MFAWHKHVTVHDGVFFLILHVPSSDTVIGLSCDSCWDDDCLPVDEIKAVTGSKHVLVQENNLLNMLTVK